MIPQPNRGDTSPPQTTNPVNQDSNNAPHERSIVATSPLHRPLKRTSTGHVVLPLIVDDAPLTDFYLHNPIDYSGLNLIKSQTGNPVEYRSLAYRSQLNHAVQILLAESARTLHSTNTASSRPLTSNTRLTVLKTRLISRMSHDISRFQRENVVDLVAAIIGLSLHDIVHGDGQEAKIHYQGLRRVLDHVGGITAEGPVAHLVLHMLYYAESMARYHHGNPLVFAQEAAVWPNNCSADNRYRLASLPKNSALSSKQTRVHHLMLLAGPEQTVLRNFTEIERLAVKFLKDKHLSPAYARTVAKRIESSLLPLMEPPEVWNMPPAIYSEQDRQLEKTLVRIGSRVGLIAVARILLMTTDSLAAETQLDHLIQSLLLEAPWRLAENGGPPDIALWASTIAIAHEDGVIRQTMTPRLAKMAIEGNLKSWPDFQQLMIDTFYPPEIMDQVVKPLWDEIALAISDIQLGDAPTEDGGPTSSTAAPEQAGKDGKSRNERRRR